MNTKTFVYITFLTEIAFLKEHMDTIAVIMEFLITVLFLTIKRILNLIDEINVSTIS